MKRKKIIIIIFILMILVLLGIYIYMQFRIPHIGEFYIRNAKDNEFSEEEKNEIYNILNLNNINVYKVACEVDFRHEGSYYIFFYSNKEIVASDIDESFKLYCLGYENGTYDYAIQKICMSTYSDSDYNKISKICETNYKWWKNNEKMIDENELRNYSLVELTNVYDENGNVID